MTITIRLTKVEVEMLKELQKKDKRHKKGLEEQVKIRPLLELQKGVKVKYQGFLAELHYAKNH